MGQYDKKIVQWFPCNTQSHFAHPFVPLRQVLFFMIYNTQPLKNLSYQIYFIILFI